MWSNEPINVRCSACGKTFKRRRGNDKKAKRYKNQYCYKCWTKIKPDILTTGRVRWNNLNAIRKINQLLKVSEKINQMRNTGVVLLNKKTLTKTISEVLKNTGCFSIKWILKQLKLRKLIRLVRVKDNFCYKLTQPV